jgi:hypothetical protein
MQWRTVILDSNNWIIGEHSIKEVMHWAIQDRPWYTLRTFTIDTPIVCPMQLKTNSWTSVDINANATPSAEVVKESIIIGHRLKFFAELYYRLEASMENLGIGNANFTIIDLHEYLVSQGVIKGTAPVDAGVQYENKMQLLQNLNNIKTQVINAILNAKNAEDFAAARELMLRLFFTNILL